MSNQKKELQKKLKIKQTLNEMTKHLNKLELSKKKYIEVGKEAKIKGLNSQYELALSGLRMVITNQKRVMEMKLNLEIQDQMKDVMKMNTEFCSSMSALSKDMLKLSNEKAFRKTQENFQQAMLASEMQQEQLTSLMDDTQAAFLQQSNLGGADNSEIEAMINNEAQIKEGTSDAVIDAEMDRLKKMMEGH